MNTVLILYPDLFACKSKFERKVINITVRMTSFSVVHQGDSRGLIEDCLSQDPRVTGIRRISNLVDAPITHAIVFDDGEVYPEIRAHLAERDIPTRWIKIPVTRVINLKMQPEYKNRYNDDGYVYIGRGSYWGNPYSIYEDGDDREEVIRKYHYDFTFDKFPKIDPQRVHELTGKRLGCFCAPEPCHGDVLANFLNNFDDGK